MKDFTVIQEDFSKTKRYHKRVRDKTTVIKNRFFSLKFDCSSSTVESDYKYLYAWCKAKASVTNALQILQQKCYLCENYSCNVTEVSSIYSDLLCKCQFLILQLPRDYLNMQIKVALKHAGGGTFSWYPAEHLNKINIEISTVKTALKSPKHENSSICCSGHHFLHADHTCSRDMFFP